MQRVGVITQNSTSSRLLRGGNLKSCFVGITDILQKFERTRVRVYKPFLVANLCEAVVSVNRHVVQKIDQTIPAVGSYHLNKSTPPPPPPHCLPIWWLTVILYPRRTFIKSSRYVIPSPFPFSSCSTIECNNAPTDKHIFRMKSEIEWWFV